MSPLCIKRTTFDKPFCATSALAPRKAFAQSMCMPRKNAQRSPLHQPSFLRKWRKFRDLSQEELAERAGVKHSTVSRLENGVSAWVQDTMEGLAEVLDCSVQELLFMDPEKPEEFMKNIIAGSSVARAGFANFLSETADSYKVS